jgi:hypothetical protein
MESLALLIVVLMSILLLSGPINIGLTSAMAQNFTEKRKVLKVLRRIVALTLGVIGIFIAIMFMYETTPLAPKLFAIIAMVGNFYALRREVKYSQSL